MEKVSRSSVRPSILATARRKSETCMKLGFPLCYTARTASQGVLLCPYGVKFECLFALFPSLCTLLQ